MSAQTRFRSPSSSLMLKSLLQRGQGALWIGLAVALAIHGALSRLAGVTEEQRAAKPLTTQFVKRQPRLTKPLELKKRPQPRRREVQRKMVSVEAKMLRERTTTPISPVGTIQSLAQPRSLMHRAVTLQQRAFEPRSLATAVKGEMQTKGAVNMTLEMVDIGALDTGKYHAMVIQDPSDKRNVSGYFHLAIVYSVTMRKQHYGQVADLDQQALHRLVASMNQWTRIKSDVSGRCPFDSEEMLRSPWVFSVCLTTFQLTASEAASLGNYLRMGGFLYTDVAQTTRGAALKGNQMMLADALATQGWERGKDWDFRRLPNTHPIYHVFFDFDSGPPTGGDFWILRNGSDAYGLPFADYLEGVEIDGRLMAILSQKCYYNPWGDWGVRGGYADMDPGRALQFGVNTIIFALTQEGSITKRVMDSVSH